MMDSTALIEPDNYFAFRCGLRERGGTEEIRETHVQPESRSNCQQG